MTLPPATATSRLSTRTAQFFVQFAWKVGVCVVVALLVGGCGAKQKAAQTPTTEASTTTTSLLMVDGQPNACGIFTATDVKAFVGNDVATGTDTGGGQGCNFAAQAPASSLLVNVQPDDSAAKFADAKSLATQQTSNVADVPGVGDEAFTYTPPDGGLASAEARSGSIRVRIVITGPQATVDMARTALVAAVAKLPANR